MWTVASMLYYFMSYYVIYLPGNVYNNTYASGAAEIVATLFGGVLLKIVNIRWAFFISNSVALFGGLLILFFGHMNESLMPVFVIVAKLGISATYLLVYAVTVGLFPTLFAATAFGTCGLTANLLTIASPYVA
jgi:OCT family organic cation transporter-like MFS transporter 4/5